MRTAAEYRKEADQYVQWADNNVSPSHRLRLLILAEDRLQLAEQVEAMEPRLPPPRITP